jgi:hypothetical protein
MDMRKMNMRKISIWTAAILLLIAKNAAAYDIGGRWLLEGSGYAEKSFVRSELTDWGTLDIQTETRDGAEYITGYFVWVELDASRLNIRTWDYSDTVLLPVPIPIPDLRPTVNEPFTLPPVTVNDLTYEVTFTSETSGTVKIYGYVDIDVVGWTEISSISVIWKEGTEKPDVPDMASGCNAGVAGVAGAILALAALSQRNRRRDKGAK